MCNNTDLPELEIISLLEEQLPVYKLRADTIFGYDQDDWLHTPLLGPDAAVDLTTEQIEETLKYFCKFVMLRFQNIITRVSCCWRVTMRDLSVMATLMLWKWERVLTPLMSPLVWANQVTVVAKTKLITAVYLTLVNVLPFRALSAHVVWFVCFLVFFFIPSSALALSNCGFWLQSVPARARTDPHTHNLN